MTTNYNTLTIGYIKRISIISLIILLRITHCEGDGNKTALADQTDVFAKSTNLVLDKGIKGFSMKLVTIELYIDGG